MKLRNPFPEEVRLLFLYVYACFDCGRSDRGLELHHITGRNDNSKENAFPICKVCHEKVKHNNEEHKKYKQITKEWLESQSNL